ncbi:hypothetical protein FA13DRAFT_1719867 [Coprinellus micaceus]|uniref:Uncharacterized protein n=1 Tax=Coprinellus micaceus TaxID=71717 RepID=A0A4Y7SAM5_COPMI|nr:hypothetical protein FA13DRAFT_1719867 [Coprinellus micaceus]
MVGWVPLDMKLRLKKAETFIDRVKRHHKFGLGDTPLILQYDKRVGDMRSWIWPHENGVPIPPNKLDQYRYTHYFKGPCCVCAFVKDDCAFSEAKMGLIQLIRQSADANCLGQYAAICAKQECDYFVPLERYFGHPNLITGEYSKREILTANEDVPIRIMDPFLFMTDDTEETIKRAGLKQIQTLRDDSNALRGTNQFLRREDPNKFVHLQHSLQTLLAKGLPADKFWDLFVQCTDCKYVMPQQYFPYYHACIVQVVHPQLGLPRRLPTPQPPDLPLSDVDHEPEDQSSDTEHEDEHVPYIDIDGKLIPVDLSSDDPIYDMPLMEACALLTQRDIASGFGPGPVTPKARCGRP